jgi:hypothetical protein
VAWLFEGGGEKRWFVAEFSFPFFFFFFAFDMLQPPNFFTGQELNSKAFPSPLLIFSI